MSFLVKAVLGQGVVHPPSHAASTLVLNGPKVPPPDGDVTTNEQHAVAVTQAAERTSGVNSRISFVEGTPRAPASADNDRVSGPTPTRTLMLRVQTCTVIQDLRDALHELESHSDLPYVIGTSEVTRFVELLRDYTEDTTIVDATLHILANVTDVDHYPSNTAGPSQHADATTTIITTREKRRICHELLHSLKDHVPLLLANVRAGVAAAASGNSSSVAGQRYALQVLQRLEEYDPTTVHKLLLRERGLAVLTDVLARPEEEVAPRQEVLALLHALTTIDTELQTLLAFDNGFDILLQVALAPSVDDTTASLALATVQNLLRNNKAAQKLFREMSCARHVAVLLDRLAQEPARLPSCGLTAVAILSCLMRDEPEGERGVVRSGLLQCKILSPLTRLAMRGLAVDDGTRIEALRTLAAMLHDSRRAIEEFVQCDVSTDVRPGPQGRTASSQWGALRAVLHYLFASSDRTMLNASTDVLLAIIGNEEAQPHVLDVLLRGLAPVADGGRGTVGWHELCECGQAFSYALFAPIVPASGKYYAAHLLRALLELPFIPGSLLHTPWPAKVGVVNDTRLTTSPATFFTTVVAYTVHCLAGGAASQGVDSAALAAYVGAVLIWLVNSRDAVSLLLQRDDGATHYKTLLQQARREGAAQVRLWCATLAACICLHAPPNSGAPTSPTRVASASDVNGPLSRNELLDGFQRQLGGPSFFESVLFDVAASSSQWCSPAPRALGTPELVVYDTRLVGLIQDIMTDFKALCAATTTTTTPRVASSPPPPPPIASVDADNRDKSSIGGGEVRQSPAVSPDPASTSVPSLPHVAHDHAAQSEGKANEEVSGTEVVMQSDMARLTVSDEAAALRETLRLRDEELRRLREANVSLCAEAVRLQAQVEDKASVTAEHASSKTATPESVVDEVVELRERVPLLEEALRAKEEEHEQLVHSLEMMERQLRHIASARGGEQEVSQLRALRDERDALLCLVAELAQRCQALGTQPTPSPVVTYSVNTGVVSEVQGDTAAVVHAPLLHTAVDDALTLSSPVHNVQPQMTTPPPSPPAMPCQTSHLDALTVNTTLDSTAPQDPFADLTQPAPFPPAASPSWPHGMSHVSPCPVPEARRVSVTDGSQHEVVRKDTPWQHELVAGGVAEDMVVLKPVTPNMIDHDGYNPFIDEPDDAFDEVGIADLR